MFKYEREKGRSSIVVSDMETRANLMTTRKGRRIIRAIEHKQKLARETHLVTSMPTVTDQRRYVDYIDAETGKRIKGRFYVTRDKKYIRAKRS